MPLQQHPTQMSGPSDPASSIYERNSRDIMHRIPFAMSANGGFDIFSGSAGTADLRDEVRAQKFEGNLVHGYFVAPSAYQNHHLHLNSGSGLPYDLF